MPRADYLQHLADSKGCLAPEGKHPLTFRFFEGLEAGSCVLAPTAIHRFSFWGDLRTGIDYVDESNVDSIAENGLRETIAQQGFHAYHILYRNRSQLAQRCFLSWKRYIS